MQSIYNMEDKITAKLWQNGLRWQGSICLWAATACLLETAEAAALSILEVFSILSKSKRFNKHSFGTCFGGEKAICSYEN